jgi:uncharacterized protein YecE (DUF72 family)
VVQPSLFKEPISSLRVGPAGWSYPDWAGTVYPEPKPRGFDPLRYLSGWFDAVEINSSFYRPPTPGMTAAWVRRVENNPNFRFTAKVWQRLTHEGSIDAQDVRAYLQGIEPLAEAARLGALLLQFPWSFKNTTEARERLEILVRLFRNFPLVVEVRHASWADAGFYRFLRDLGIGFCNVDQPLIGQSLKPSSVVTSPVGYFRLHGRNYANWFKEDAGRDNRYDYLYTIAELDQLTSLIQEVRDASEECYVITNNHFRGKAVFNGLELQQRLTGRQVEPPPSLAREYK